MQRLSQEEGNTEVDVIPVMSDVDSEELDNIAELDAETNFAGVVNESPSRKMSTLVRLTESRMENKMPKKDGMLAKWSPALLSGFKDKYVVLENKILKYYNMDNKNEPVYQGELNFDLYLVEIQVDES